MAPPHVLPQVRPHDWPGQERCNTKPIHNRLEPGPGRQTLPLVALTFSAHGMAAFVGARWLEIQGTTIEAARQEGLRNLAAEPYEITVSDIPAPDGAVARVGMLQGKGASETADHILDEAAMKALHGRLGADPMVVTIPHRGALLAADVQLALAGPFVRLAQTPAPAGAEALTTMVFLMQQGQITGKLTYG